MRKTEKTVRDFAKISGIVHVVLNIFLVLWLAAMVIFVLDWMFWQSASSSAYFILTMRIFMGAEAGEPIMVIPEQILVFLSILYMRDLFKHFRQGESSFSVRVLRVVKLLAGVAFVNFIFDLSLPRMFFVLAMLSLYVIFKHGLVLQNEADQTL